MAISNSEYDVESQSENDVVVQIVDDEQLRLVDRILALEGQRIRLLRELVERQSHHPGNQIPRVCFRL